MLHPLVKSVTICYLNAFTNDREIFYNVASFQACYKLFTVLKRNIYGFQLAQPINQFCFAPYYLVTLWTTLLSLFLSCHDSGEGPISHCLGVHNSNIVKNIHIPIVLSWKAITQSRRICARATVTELSLHVQHLIGSLESKITTKLICRKFHLRTHEPLVKWVPDIV